MPIEIFEGKDNVHVVPGDRVTLLWDVRDGEPTCPCAECNGVIEHISDPDGDVDDYGRTIHIPPKAHIKLDSGDNEEIAFWWDWNRDVWYTDELKKVSDAS